MSKIPGHNPPHQEVDHAHGELRRQFDRHDQPGQGADLTPPNAGTMNPRNDRAAQRELDPRNTPPPGPDTD